MDKMRGVVVVLYVRDFFGRIKKYILVLHGRHNSPKRTIIRTIDMDVISSSQRRQWHFSWHYHSPLRLSISLFLLYFGRWDGVRGDWHKAWAFLIQRVFGMHTRHGQHEVIYPDNGFTWRHGFSLPHDVMILC